MQALNPQVYREQCGHQLYRAGSRAHSAARLRQSQPTGRLGQGACRLSRVSAFSVPALAAELAAKARSAASQYNAWTGVDWRRACGVLHLCLVLVISNVLRPGVEQIPRSDATCMLPGFIFDTRHDSPIPCTSKVLAAPGTVTNDQLLPLLRAGKRKSTQAANSKLLKP